MPECPNHVRHGYTLGDTDNQTDPAVCGLHYGIPRKRRRDKYHRRVGAFVFHGLVHGIEDGTSQMRLPSLAWRYPRHDAGAKGNHLLHVEAAFSSRGPLYRQTGVAINQYAH